MKIIDEDTKIMRRIQRRFKRKSNRPKKRFHYIFHRLLQYPITGIPLCEADFMEEFGVCRCTFQTDLFVFRYYGFVTYQRHFGHIPTSKFFDWAPRLKKEDPMNYCFEKPYQEIYGIPGSCDLKTCSNERYGKSEFCFEHLMQRVRP